VQNSKFVKAMLIFSGVLLIFLGGAYLFTPIEFYNSANQTDISGKINLLSEIRASGGALLFGGLLVLLGAFKPQLTYTSTVISIMIWLGYGLARVLAIFADGMASEALFVVMLIEIMIGVAGIFAIKKYALEQPVGA